MPSTRRRNGTTHFCLAAIVAALAVSAADASLANSCYSEHKRGKSSDEVRLVIVNKTEGKLTAKWYKHCENADPDKTLTVKAGETKNWPFSSGKGNKVTYCVTVDEAEAGCWATTKNTDNGNSWFYEADCTVGNENYSYTCSRDFNNGADFNYWRIKFTFTGGN